MFKSLVLYFKKRYCKKHGHNLKLTTNISEDDKFIFHRQSNDCVRCGHKGMSNVIKQRKGSSSTFTPIVTVSMKGK